jgi:signal transduction histidine kinase
MDEQIHRRLTLASTTLIIATTIVLLFHTTQLSTGLVSLACGYVILVLVRDYILKLDLQRFVGTLFIILQLIIVLFLTIWSESFFAQVYSLILVGEFAFYHSRNYSLLFTLVSFLSSLFSNLIYHQFPPFEEIYYILPRAIDYFAIFGICLLAKLALQQKNQLICDNEQLRIASVELEEKARLQERTRISREIHDSVGHTLTSALTGLQTASRAIHKNEYMMALEMIDRTNETIGRGLNDVRTSVHLLRDKPRGDLFISELIRFIHDTMKITQVNITFDIDPTIPELPPMTELTIYRALQEGITNGIRHGASSQFQFSFTQQSGLIQFVLSNQGTPPLQLVEGFGLKSMRERVEGVGGELTISSGSSSHGVTLAITIPIEATIEQMG